MIIWWKLSPMKIMKSIKFHGIEKKEFTYINKKIEVRN